MVHLIRIRRAIWIMMKFCKRFIAMMVMDVEYFKYCVQGICIVDAVTPFCFLQQAKIQDDQIVLILFLFFTDHYSSVQSLQMFSFILDSGDAQASTARTSTKEVLLESPANRLPNVLSILDEETCLNSSLFLLAVETF